MSLELHLKTCGWLLLGLAALHPAFAKHFRWREELAGVSLFTRQVFWVHSLFIVLVLVIFGALSICFASALMERSVLAKALLGVFVFFWAARLFAQHFIYSPALWRHHRFNTFMHIVFTALWAYLVAAYGAALWKQFGEP